ncbi:MAG: DUF3604 domain-containing protein [Planctomycetota bacterium]|nr:MAG: DUF3604 domain-containing protein [Planctomycetota bacterium]
MRTKRTYGFNKRCLSLFVFSGLILLASTSQVWAAETGKRLIFNSSFEPNQPQVRSEGLRVVKGTARTGDYCLVGRVDKPDRFESIEIPFEAKKNSLVNISFWVRSDNHSACAVMLKKAKKREHIGEIKRVATADWERMLCSFRTYADTVAIIQICGPSSFNAPAGRMWLDDLRILEIPSELNWPDSVQTFPSIDFDRKGNLWLAAAEARLPERRICVYKGVSKPRRVCTLVVEGLTGVSAPAVAGVDSGCLVAFGAEVDDKWRMAYAFVSDADPQKTSCKFIDCGGSANISPAIAVVGRRACMVWESNAGGNRSIYACWVDRNSCSQPQRISSSDSNSYNPDIVALANGDLFAAWDSVRNQSADIYGAWFKSGRWQDEIRITSGKRIERHPALAAKGNELWLAWQAQSYKELRIDNVSEQRIAVARLDGNELLAPLGLYENVSKKKERLIRPRIAFDGKGRLWLTVRRTTDRVGWQPVAYCYAGNQWSEFQSLCEQIGRWYPVKLAGGGGTLGAGIQYDDLDRPGGHHGIADDFKSGVMAVPVANDRMTPGKLKTEPLKMPDTDFSLKEQIELCGADFPRQKWNRNGKKLKLFWGTLHNHTDISICGRTTNPPGHDLLANARDIELQDFCALTDHGFNFDNPMWIYNGEQTRNNHDPGRFITFLGLEWTSKDNPPAVPGEPNRYGHRNFIYLNTYYDQFHDAMDGDITPFDVWRQIRKTEFVSIPHQLADWRHKGKGNPPTDWNYVDEKLQPVAEIHQARASYEYLGCPRQSKSATPFKGYFLQDAWAKGIIIGVIASPDHGGGLGKAGVWAEELTRESIFRAIQARHTFGTSAPKMALWFGAGDAMMGDKVRRLSGSVTFLVKALAMQDIKEVVIFRNNKIVYRVEPGVNEFKARWTDESPPDEKKLWYYARIHTVDDHLAWSSPIWFVR